MRMSNEEFTNTVLTRGRIQIEQRRQTIQKRVKIGAFCALAAMICSPIVLKVYFGGSDATNTLMSDEAIAGGEQAEYEMNEESSEECADEAPTEDGAQMNSSAKDRNGSSDQEQKAEPSQEAEAEMSEEAEESSEETPDIPETIFSEMPEADIFAYYGISGLPEQLGGLTLVSDRTSATYGGRQLGIAYADDALTVPADDANIWIYTNQEDSAQNLTVMLSKAQDGDDDTITYADGENNTESAYFSNGVVAVWISASSVTHETLAAAAEELKAYLS